VKAGTAQVASRLPDIQVKGSWVERMLRADYELVLNDSRLASAEGRAACAGIEVKGDLSMDRRVQVDTDVNLSAVSLAAGSYDVVAPLASFRVHGGQTVQGHWQFAGEAFLNKASMIDQVNGVAAKEISAALPLQWPVTDDAVAPAGGMLKVGQLQWQGREAGSLSGKLRQVGPGLSYDVTHASKLFPGMIVQLKGRATMAGAEVGIRLPPYQLRGGSALVKLVPALSGYKVNGRIEASSDLTLGKAGLDGFIKLSVKDGAIVDQQQKLVLEGIQTTLDIIDPAALKSAPGQRLEIDHLVLGNIKADALAVAFQIQSFRQFVVEKSTMQWCRGTIGTETVSLGAEMDDIDAVLICRNVNLAVMLEQLGVAQGTGDVTVSGRIPVHWVKGRLSFAKGFLTSPPGQSGVIQLREIKGTNQILSGLPADTPQQVQLDIAMEALKDYTYSNVDLRLESEADTLVFRLSLEGKPNQPLPFVYDQELGQFKRVEGQGQAEFKGIGIDLNLRSPLNQILRYKELFKPKQR
jgi:hypothetical protein